MFHIIFLVSCWAVIYSQVQTGRKVLSFLLLPALPSMPRLLRVLLMWGASWSLLRSFPWFLSDLTVHFLCPCFMWEHVKLHSTWLAHHFTQLTELETPLFCPKTIWFVELLLSSSQPNCLSSTRNNYTRQACSCPALVGASDTFAALLHLSEMIHILLLLFICVVLHLPLLTASFLQTSRDSSNSPFNFITCCWLKTGENASGRGKEILSASTLPFTMGFHPVKDVLWLFHHFVRSGRWWTRWRQLKFDLPLFKVLPVCR